MKRLTISILAGAMMMTGLTGTEAAELPFKTATLQQQTIQNRHLFEGTVEAINKTTVSAQTSGRISKIKFDIDDFVRAGEIILEIHDKEQRAAVEQAENAVKAAAAQRKAAEEDFKRVEKLFASGTVSRARFDNSKSAFDSAVANEGRSKAALSQAREHLSYTIVKAPYSGFVVARHVELGEMANPGKPLMTGFSLEALRVRVDVPEQFAAPIRSGNKAILIIDGGKQIKATGITVFPFADPKSNTVTIRLDLPHGTKAVFPGMLVKAGFVTGTMDALAIPDTAIVRRGEVTGAYIVTDDDKVQLQQIRIGRKLDGDKYEVLSGLQAGDRVALDPLAASVHLHKKRGTKK